MAAKNHAWIISVCEDLHTYAQNNQLPEVAASVSLALDAALREIGHFDAPSAGVVSGATHLQQGWSERDSETCLVIPFRKRVETN